MTDLTEDSLEAALKQIRKHVEDGGVKMTLDATHLIVHESQIEAHGGEEAFMAKFPGVVKVTVLK